MMRPVSGSAQPALPTLGVDFGNVITVPSPGNADSMFGDTHLDAPAADDAFCMLRTLGSDQRFGALSVVSKPSEKMQQRTREWMAHQGSHETIGIPPERAIHFVRAVSDKASVCRRLGVTHFVDDRIVVLDSMPRLTGRYLFRPTKPPQTPPGMAWVSSWVEFADLLRQRPGRGRPGAAESSNRARSAIPRSGKDTHAA